MYALCEIYFTQTDKSSSKRKREDFISVNNYNLVFEDMIDKLFSDEINDTKIDDVSLQDLKKNERRRNQDFGNNTNGSWRPLKEGHKPLGQFSGWNFEMPREKNEDVAKDFGPSRG